MIDPDDPRHGTYAGVIAHGRAGVPMCEPCTLARRRMNKAAHLDRHRGRPRTTTLGDQAWNIVDTWPRDQLHRVTGLRVDKIIRYHNGGPTMRVLRTTRDRILTAATLTYWTPIGIQRRVMALGRLGWSMRALSADTGIDVDTLKRLWKREAVFVRADVADDVIAAYERLSMTTPPSGRSATRARREAEERGWAPPLAWDCIDTDAEPRGVGYKPRHVSDKYTANECDATVVERILGGDWGLSSTPAEKAAVVARWVADGRSLNDLERRTGWNCRRYVDRGDAA